jgi:hypothetical protein
MVRISTNGHQSYLFFYTLLVVGDCWWCLAYGATTNNGQRFNKPDVLGWNNRLLRFILVAGVQLVAIDR